jgi:hypothetical protein
MPYMAKQNQVLPGTCSSTPTWLKQKSGITRGLLLDPYTTQTKIRFYPGPALRPLHGSEQKSGFTRGLLFDSYMAQTKITFTRGLLLDPYMAQTKIRFYSGPYSKTPIRLKQK